MFIALICPALLLEYGLRRKYRVSSIEPNFGIDRYRTFCGIEPALVYRLYMCSNVIIFWRFV